MTIKKDDRSHLWN